jgi:hypothetical protein
MMALPSMGIAGASPRPAIILSDLAYLRTEKLRLLLLFCDVFHREWALRRKQAAG